MTDIILKLHNDGLTNRKIAKQLNIHHSTVAKKLAEFGIKSVWANEVIMETPNGAICSKCLKEKPLSEFQHGCKNSHRVYRFSYCTLCRKEQVYLNLNKSVESFLNDRYNRLKRRAAQSRIPFNLTKEYFISLYYLQNGECAYTGVRLICKVGEKLSAYSLSVDKIIPDLGYVVGNVVFCANRINTIKHNVTIQELQHWMPVFYDNLYKLHHTLNLICFQVAEGDF